MSFRPAAPRARRACTTAVAALGLGALVVAHVQLLNPSNGNELHWSSDDVSVVIQRDGSDDIDDGSHFPALRNSIDAWNDATGTSIRMVEDTTPSQQGRTDWESSGVHLLYFDEQNASGYFPSGSGIVAVTPIFFTSSGRIVDADVLFNGRGFRFTTNGASGAFDVADVATHELGHLLGLDHSAWAGASMYPYVDPRVILHRSLSLDDVHGLRNAYPEGSSASVRGRVRRVEDESKVAGAHVVARDSAGRPTAGTLTDSDGDFVIRGLEAGTYELYASPLGQPVSAANLGEGWEVDTDFQSTILGSVTVESGSSDLEDVFVDADTSLSLGRASDDYPLRAIIGEQSPLSIRGTGLSGGGTLSCSDSSIGVEVSAELGILLQLTLDVPEGATPGHLDLMYTSASGERSILTAGIELTPADPTVELVSPASGVNDGGANLTIVGSGFRPGARVVIGDRVYEEGVDGCELVDSETITLTTAEMIGGLHDVVVIDQSGVEGRLLDGFQATAFPVLTLVFPEVGSSAGGTEIYLSGDDFVSGMSVTINGIAQSEVDVLEPGLARVTTLAAAAGGPYVLTVTNPAGAEASAAFTFLDSPDPTVSSVSPDSGSDSGGTDVTLRGTGFDESTQVYFGADAATGIGGEEAEVEFVDSTTLLVTTPSASAGMADVMVQNSETNQAAALPDAFQYQGSSSSSSSTKSSIFGGCASVSPAGPVGPVDVLMASAWLIAAFVIGVARWRLLSRRLHARPLRVRVSVVPPAAVRAD